MCVLIGVLIVASLLSCQVCGQVDCSTQNFTSPPPTCPGDQLVFYCSTFDNSGSPVTTTVWTVNGSSLSNLQCLLPHSQWSMSPSSVCESSNIQATEESPQDCFISTLTNNASLSLDGVEVACFFDIGASGLEVGRGTINIIGPVNTTSVSCEAIHDGSSSNTRNLTISWTTDEDVPEQTSHYFVSVLPLGQTGRGDMYNVTPGSSEFMNKQLEVEVEVGTEYQITVRADNCGDRQEGSSVTIPVFQNVPLPPRIGNVRRVERNESGVVVLYALDITIIDSTVSCDVGPTESFTISSDPSALSDDIHCNATIQPCSISQPDLYASQFDITTSNAAGESSAVAYMYTIDFVIDSVEIRSCEDPSNVTVTLSEGGSDPVNCSFMFGSDSTYMTLPSEGGHCSIDNEEITFVLNSLLENTTYYYNISCEVDSITTSVLQGRFRKGCSEADLVREGGECDVMNNETVAMYSANSLSHCIEGNVTRICMCDGNWDGTEPVCPRVATDQKLEAWQIVVIVIGIVSLLIGSSVCSVLGTMLVLRASTKTEGVIGVLMVVVSAITFIVSLITICVIKKREWDEKEVKLRPLYKLLIIVSMVIMVITVIVWIVLIVYIASNEFYDDGYVRGDDGVCVASDSDSQKVGRTVLVVVCLLLSLLVTLEWCVVAALWRWGTAAVDHTDSGKPPPKPKRSKKLKKKAGEEQELAEMYDTLQHGKTPSSPTPLIDPGDPTYGHLQQKKGEGGDQADEYSHIQRGEKPKAVPNPADPTYSHFKQGGGADEYSQLNRGKGVSTLPGAVPPQQSDASYGKLEKEEEKPSEYDVVTNEPRHKPRKRDKQN